MASLRLRVKGPTGEQHVITAAADESVADFSVRMQELFKIRENMDILTGFPPRPVTREVGGTLGAVVRSGDSVVLRCLPPPAPAPGKSAGASADTTTTAKTPPPPPRWIFKCLAREDLGGQHTSLALTSMWKLSKRPRRGRRRRRKPRQNVRGLRLQPLCRGKRVGGSTHLAVAVQARNPNVAVVHS